MIQYLATEIDKTSVASKICQKWRINRQIVKDCQTTLSHNRALQVTLNNLLCATRFKVVVEGKLVPVRCPKQGCGQQDSWEHFIDCYEVPDISSLEGKEKIEALVELCIKIQTTNPSRPMPCASEEDPIKDTG